MTGTTGAVSSEAIKQADPTIAVPKLPTCVLFNAEGDTFEPSAITIPNCSMFEAHFLVCLFVYHHNQSTLNSLFNVGLRES